MTDSLPTIEETSRAVETNKPQTSARSLRFALLFAAGCFVLALIVALAQNLRKPIIELAMLFDSGAYVMAVKYVMTAMQNFAHGMAFETAVKSVGETLMLNGPVLPGLGAIYFTIIGKEPTLVDMRAPIVLQAFIHASAAALLALAGWRFTGGRLIGLFAGIVFAIWPPAIIGASRFLTETITTLFISASLLSASYIPQIRRNLQLGLSPFAAFIFGSTAAFLILVKAALAPGTLLTIAAVVLVLLLSKVEKRSLLLATITATFGFCLVFAPWLLFTKIATGEFSLTSRRLPTFNMAAGLSPETDGFSALPETPLVKMFSETDGPGAVAYAFYSINPGDFYGRMARKPLRLFQFPWNDCRVDFLGLPTFLQIIVHQILMVFGFFGLLAFVSLPLTYRANKSVETGTADTPPTASAINLAAAEPEMLSTILIGVASLSMIGGHLAYLPFVADSRYGFTATPCLIIFAIWCFAGQYGKSINKAAAIKLCIAASFIMLAFTLKEDVWRSMFATSYEAIFASSLTLGALLLFIGCLMAVRTLLGTDRTNASAKVLALTSSYLSLTLVLAASLLSKESPYDWEAKLSPNEQFCRTINLPQSFSKPDNAMVLASLRGDWRAARLKVNGQEINSSPISLLHLTGNPALGNDYRTFSWILKTDTSGLEQWRVFIIPPKLLKPGSNVISLSESKAQPGVVSLTGGTTCGDTQKDGNSCFVSAPSWYIFSPTKLFRNPLSVDPRLREKTPKTVTQGLSTRRSENKINQDLSNAFGIQHGQYHLFLLVDGEEKPKDQQPKAATQTNPLYIDLRPSPHLSGSQRGKASNSAVYEGRVTIPADALTASHIRLKLTGEAQSPGALDVKFWLNDLRLLDAPVDLACYPSRIEGSGKRTFTLEAIARVDVVDAKSVHPMIKISSDQVPLSVSNLRLEVEPLTAPALTISGKRWF
ncbi:MAG: hypothetical protein C0469_01185 [Cyanobacteria bacterium DS2.3.42]|nr:hypothetical protein [Cyanobacteria bacterium DS2.3.42]